MLRLLLLLALLVGFARPAAAQSEVTAFDLIIAMNTLRASNGLPQLIEDPIVDAVAQATAQIMADNQMSSHIGDVRGRLAAAGYGGGAQVWATENFAVGMGQSIDQIMLVWADPTHMIPAVNPAYCHVGAGVAKSANGRTYYVLQAAYTSAKSCGEYKSPEGVTNNPEGQTNQGRVPGVSQLIVPVKVATPDADGRVYHEVKAGQSFWAIAIAYKITISDIEKWNNISRDAKLQVGQRLFIPGENTEGYATPTPVGMIVPATPDSAGRVIHTVASYQTLTTIAAAYKTSVDALLGLNGWQVDWPLQIGQKLVIDPGHPSPTPRPLTPVEKLTPEADGKYYHTVLSGETLSWIAGLYDVPMNDLMAWNGLNSGSIIYPDMKLLLQVTPPATATLTPGPPTLTPTVTPISPTATPSPTPSQASASPTPAAAQPEAVGSTPFIWLLPIGVAGAVALVVFSRRRK